MESSELKCQGINCRMLKSFANNWDSDHDQHKFSPDLDQN